MTILETERLRLREATHADAAFVLRLINEPGWHQYISDPGVRTLQAARDWIDSRLIGPCREHGHGFWLVERREGAELVGLCGLFRRPTLPGPDLGYALLSEAEGQGYAFEAASGCVALARERFKWQELLAITSPENPRSHALLRRLEFADQGLQQIDGYAEASRIWRLAL